jgi:hypothetical protein
VPSRPGPSGVQELPSHRAMLFTCLSTGRAEQAAGDEVAVRQHGECVHIARVTPDAGAERLPRRAVPSRDVVDEGGVGDRELTAGDEVAVRQLEDRGHCAVRTSGAGSGQPVELALGGERRRERGCCDEGREGGR